VELKAGGANIPVTKANCHEYVDLYIDYVFNKSCEHQLNSFQKGFYRVFDRDLMTVMLKPEELEKLICGSSVLDFTELEKVAKYVDGFTASTPTIKWLWEIIHNDFTLQ
jgi:hypothetical protein